MTPDLVRTSRQQGGCFTFDQALALGMTWGQLRSAVARGLIVRILPRVYAFAGSPVDQRLRSHAALLQHGPEAYLSHLSAGARWTFTGPARGVTITIPHGHRVTEPEPWLRVVRTRHPESVVLDGTRVAPRPRTVIDLASVLPPRELEAMLLRVVQKRWVTVEEVSARLDLLGPRAGAAALRRVIATYDPGFESRLSKELWELVVSAGFPEAEMGVPITLADVRHTEVTPDAVLQRIRQGFEADGNGPHGTLTAIRHDKWKDRELAKVGWANTRFTTEDIQRWKKQTRRDIQDVVRQRERDLRHVA